MFILLIITTIVSLIATCYYIIALSKDECDNEALQAQIEEHEETIAILDAQLSAKNNKNKQAAAPKPEPVYVFDDNDDEILDYNPTEDERNEYVS